MASKTSDTSQEVKKLEWLVKVGTSERLYKSRSQTEQAVKALVGLGICFTVVARYAGS